MKNQNNSTQYTYKIAYYYTIVIYIILVFDGVDLEDKSNRNVRNWSFLNDGTEQGNIIFQLIAY